MLQQAKDKLQKEVGELTHELNVILPDVLNKAIAQGDLKENGDYHAAKERMQFVQSRLADLRSRLSKLSDIDLSKIPNDCVGLGSRVEVEDLDSGDSDVYELVVPDAMDLDLGHISVASPIGQALMGTNVDDEVEVRLPLTTRNLRIKQLTTIHELSEGS